MKKLLTLLLIIFSAKSFSQCGGQYLWNIKIATDNAIIDTVAYPVSIDSLVAIPRPAGADVSNHQRLSEESCMYTVTGKIIYWMLEADKDIHLAVQSLDSTATIVCEIPDPTCPDMQNSLFLKQITDARNSFLNYKGTKHTMQEGVYRITGVLFYDKPHHAIGANDKHVELHPVIKFEKL